MRFFIVFDYPLFSVIKHPNRSVYFIMSKHFIQGNFIAIVCLVMFDTQNTEGVIDCELYDIIQFIVHSCVYSLNVYIG